MKAILTVGYNRLLLPLDEATKAMRILGRAVLVRKEYGPGPKHEEQIMIESDELTLELEIVKAKTRVYSAFSEDLGGIEDVALSKKRAAKKPARLTNGNDLLRLT